MELLPDELFENICRHLPSLDIKSMMLVDNYSRTLIENSPVLMDKLPLYVSDMNDAFSDEYENGRELLPLMCSRRKVRKVIVDLKKDKIMKYLGIFQKFGHSIRNLDINNYTFETIDQLRFVLRLLPKLKTLTVKNVTFQRGENKFLNSIVQVPRVTLHELRNIICVNSDPKIFSLFTINHNNIRAIRLALSDSSAFHYCDFIETLGQQTKLKQLTFQGITDNCDIFSYDHLVVSQLDALVIENCFVGGRDQMKCLVEMIKNQRKLKSLKILNTPIQISTDILSTYRQILSSPHISELHLDIRDLLVFHRHNFVNKTVTELIVHGNFKFEFLPVFINFIKMFPNTVRLNLVGNTPIGDKYLYYILSTFPELEVLHIPALTSRAVDSNFSNLSTLDSKLHTLILDFIDFEIKFFGWKNIVSNLRTIEKLIVKRDYGNVSNEIIDLIIKNLTLKHLELGIGVVSEKILQNIISTNFCNQLKVLKIAKIDFDKMKGNFVFSQIFERNRLLLHMCEDDYFQSISNCLSYKSNDSFG